MMRNVWICWLAGLELFVRSTSAGDAGIAFSYQGFLENPVGTPVTDTCTLEFLLCDDEVAACAPGTVSSHPGVVVTDGVFTVADVDFGMNAIDGSTRWLEIKVQCPGDATPVTLSPRQEIKPAPYSIRAVEGVGGPNALHVMPSGDVGIGTTTPLAQLDVNGSVRSTAVEITGGTLLVPSAVGWGSNYSGEIDVPYDTSVIAAGGGFSLAIRSDGTLAGWGENNYGQINVPIGTFFAVEAGGGFAIGIRTDGTLVSWGNNVAGQTNVSAGVFEMVSAGAQHCVGIRSNGTLVAWGANNYNQTVVPSGTFIAVAAGNEYGVAIRSDGTLVGWGLNNEGQINVPSGTFVAVAAYNSHSIAIRSDGTLAGWGGQNEVGQINVPSGTFSAVAAGNSHSIAIRTDGTLIGWGHNVNGQIDVPAGTYSQLAAGSTHNLAIRSDAPQSNPALRLHMDSAVKPGTNTWTIFSDRRLKKSIEPLSGALERMLQLHGVTFQWRDPASQGGITGTQIGLIADEVQRAFPQWVGRDPNGYQTLTVGGFEALTAEAVRELRHEKDAQIEALRGENIELRGRLQRLEATIARMAEHNVGGSR